MTLTSSEETPTGFSKKKTAILTVCVLVGMAAYALFMMNLGNQWRDEDAAKAKLVSSIMNNTDPHLNWVPVAVGDYSGLTGDVFKRCDGTTLVYQSRERNQGLSVVSNSPECK